MARTQMLPLALCLLTLFAAAGCQPTTTSRLLGKWQGRPDTAAARAARQASATKQGPNSPGENTPDDAGTPNDDTETGSGPTDLERFDVLIELEFRSGGKARMSLAGGESFDAVWRVVAGIPPNGAEIELGRLAASSDQQAGDQANQNEEKVVEKRRFLIDFQQDGDSEGFTLREKGADPKFGRLYFTPAQAAPPSAPPSTSSRTTSPATPGAPSDDGP